MPLTEPELSQPLSSPATSPGQRRTLVAVFLSSVIPGSGHFLLEEWQKGAAFLAAAILLVLTALWLRLPSELSAITAALYLMWGTCIASLISAIRCGRLKGKPVSRWWLALLIPITLAAQPLYSRLIIQASGFGVLRIVSSSMEKTVMAGEFVMTDKRYHPQAPSPGEVILFRKNDLILIKRVAAIGGSTVEGRDGTLFVDGHKADEPYVQHISKMPDPMTLNFGPVTVPPGKLFVLGDNRDLSLDSRFPSFGFVDTGSIWGKPLYVISFKGARNGLPIN